MMLKTQTHANFLFLDPPSDWEYTKEQYGNELDAFAKSTQDVVLETYLEGLLAQKALIVAQGVHRIVIHHSIFYSESCDTEFSPRVIALMHELGATFAVFMQRVTEGEDLYAMLDKIRWRPSMWLGEMSITLLFAFIDGYLHALNGEREETPPFSGFNDFIGAYYGKYTTPGWKNLILEAHNGDEEKALLQFFVFLDEYRAMKNTPNSRDIVLRLLHVAMLDFRAEDDHQRQKQIADLMHHVSNQLKTAIYCGLFWFDKILEDIFNRARDNGYLHHWIKVNAPKTAFYECELWSGEDEGCIATTVIKSDHEQKHLIVGPNEKLIKTFFAINNDQANGVKEAFHQAQSMQEEQHKIIQHHHLTFFTEYYQFYVLDSETKATTDADDFWCPDADQRRLAIGEGLLGVTVAKYAEIKVDVRVLSQKPMPHEEADHIVEVSLKLPSGILQLKDCTAYDTVLELKLGKGTYQVRISSFNLKSVSGDVGEDYYVVEIWKSRFAKAKVLKAWT